MKWILAFFGGLALLAAAVVCAGAHAQTAPQPGAPVLTPLNLSMEKLQLDTLKCRAFEAEANFHAFNAQQIAKDRDALTAKIKELEATIAALTPKDPPAPLQVPPT
jgi:hypothetical protein